MQIDFCDEVTVKIFGKRVNVPFRKIAGLAQKTIKSSLFLNNSFLKTIHEGTVFKQTKPQGGLSYFFGCSGVELWQPYYLVLTNMMLLLFEEDKETLPEMYNLKAYDTESPKREKQKSCIALNMMDNKHQESQVTIRIDDSYNYN